LVGQRPPCSTRFPTRRSSDLDLEVEMVRRARERDMLTCPYVFDEDSARAMTAAGADVIVPHVGLTTKGSIGAETALTLEEAARRSEEHTSELQSRENLVCRLL